MPPAGPQWSVTDDDRQQRQTLDSVASLADWPPTLCAVGGSVITWQIFTSDLPTRTVRHHALQHGDPYITVTSLHPIHYLTFDSGHGVGFLSPAVLQQAVCTPLLSQL